MLTLEPAQGSESPSSQERLLDPPRPATWIAAIEQARGRLASTGQGHADDLDAQLCALSNWLERERNPMVRARLFQGGKFAGATGLLPEKPAAQGDAERGHADGWNACRVVIAHLPPGAALPPPRQSSESFGVDAYHRGYDQGWGACLVAARRLLTWARQG